MANDELLVQVDISPLMIKKTRDAGSYDELHSKNSVLHLNLVVL